MIAEAFNSFFVNIGRKLADKIAIKNIKTFNAYPTMRIMSSLHFYFVDSTAVTKKIHSLNTKYSAGHDGISLKFLKTVASAIINPLTFVINESLATGLFPDSFKIAKVIPLYKKTVMS